jgi:hypothetical protein
MQDHSENRSQKDETICLHFCRFLSKILWIQHITVSSSLRDHRNRMVVGFTTAYAIGAYHHSCEFESHSWRGLLDTVWWSLSVVFSDYSGFFTTEIDRHDITEILLEVGSKSYFFFSTKLATLLYGTCKIYRGHICRWF